MPTTGPQPDIDTIGRLTVVGPGLLGASVALALRQAGWRGRILGVARRPTTLAAALEIGAIDRGVDSLAAALREPHDGPELVILCTPLGTFTPLLAELAALQHKQMLITDVGSTKQAVCDDAGRLLPHPQLFVGSHPMAGSEQQGPEGARAELFKNKPCILTPAEDVDPDALGAVRSLWEKLGMQLLTMSPADHDADSATISHLPHLAAVLLVRCAMERGGTDIASTGFRDTTRLASSNPPMRADILTANKAHVLAALDCLEREAAAIREKLATDDRDGLLDLLENTKAFRDAWANGFESEKP